MILNPIYFFIRKPYNLNEFLNSFESIQMRSVPNVFVAILGTFPHQQLDSLFGEKDQTAYFLDNSGIHSWVWAFFTSIKIQEIIMNILFN